MLDTVASNLDPSVFPKDVALYKGKRNRVVNKSNRIKMVIQLNVMLSLRYTVPVFFLHSPTSSNEATLPAAMPPVLSTIPGVLVLNKCFQSEESSARISRVLKSHSRQRKGRLCMSVVLLLFPLVLLAQIKKAG